MDGQALAPPERCGNCRFGGLIPADLKSVTCKGLPPTPVVVGMGPQGPVVSNIYVNMARDAPACALWKSVQTILLAKV